MPEGRMVKKCISDSKSLGKLKSDSARLLYTWLIPHLDVVGRYSADPDLLKGHIFPKVKSMTPKKIERLLYELAKSRLVVLFKSDEETYLELQKFHDYQKIDPHKEAKSKIPAPTRDSMITLDNSRATLENSSTSKVKESKVKVNSIAQTELEQAFQKWWSLYPRKEDKGKAKELWLRIVESGIDPELLETALIGYLQVEKSKGTERWHIKYAKTFLYNGNKTKNIPSTWEPYVQYGKKEYKPRPDL